MANIKPLKENMEKELTFVDSLIIRQIIALFQSDVVKTVFVDAVEIKQYEAYVVNAQNIVENISDDDFLRYMQGSASYLGQGFDPPTENVEEMKTSLKQVFAQVPITVEVAAPGMQAPFLATEKKMQEMAMNSFIKNFITKTDFEEFLLKEGAVGSFYSPSNESFHQAVLTAYALKALMNKEAAPKIISGSGLLRPYG